MCIFAHSDVKVSDPQHLQVLGHSQVLQLCLLSQHALVLSIRRGDSFLPHLRCHPVLVNHLAVYSTHTYIIVQLRESLRRGQLLYKGHSIAPEPPEFP